MLSAYECVFRVIPLIFKLTPNSFAEAKRLLLAAQHADPLEPLVYAWHALWFFLNISQGWAKDLAATKDEVDYMVRRAIELDPDNALALAVAGHISSFVHHDYEQAFDLLEKSVMIDPNSAYTWSFSALTLCYTGNAKEALRRLEGVQKLWRYNPNPYYFYYCQTCICIALLFTGHYDRAIKLGKRTVSEYPNLHATYRPLIASLGHQGRLEEAREYLTMLKQLEPDFSIDWFRAKYPPLHKDYKDRYIEYLRKAGVPED